MGTQWGHEPVYQLVGQGTSREVGPWGGGEQKTDSPCPRAVFSCTPSALGKRKQESALNTNQEKTLLSHFLPLPCHAGTWPVCLSLPTCRGQSRGEVLGWLPGDASLSSAPPPLWAWFLQGQERPPASGDQMLPGTSPDWTHIPTSPSQTSREGSPREVGGKGTSTQSSAVHAGSHDRPCTSVELSKYHCALKPLPSPETPSLAPAARATTGPSPNPPG